MTGQGMYKKGKRSTQGPKEMEKRFIKQRGIFREKEIQSTIREEEKKEEQRGRKGIKGFEK